MAMLNNQRVYIYICVPITKDRSWAKFDGHIPSFTQAKSVESEPKYNKSSSQRCPYIPAEIILNSLCFILKLFMICHINPISYLYCNIYHITVKHNQWYIILNQTTSVFFYIFFYILFCITYCLRDSWPRCLPRRLSATPLAPRSGWCRWSDWDWTRSWRLKPEHFTTRNRVQLSVEVVNTRN